jgi:2-dehydro-3-deoxyphosphogluconate aldolase/(4S)-4-hydroxy-2-oxoglutarate aldolase
MDKKATLLKLIPEQGILPLYFYKDTDVSLEVLKALYRAGIRTVEYTNRGEAALQNFKKMRELCDAQLKDMYLGIGTIKNGKMAQTFIDAGADFIICPEFMSAIKTLFPDLLFMPTGGVDLDKENISKWLKAGVCAVGMGSKLVSKELLEQKNYAKIEELATQALEILKSLK